MDNRRRMLLSGGLSADPVLENNDWATISKVAKAGKAAEFWNIGDLKNISIGGVTYAAQIIGFDHDDVANPTAYGMAKAGITFQLKTYYAKYPFEATHTNKNGWGGSQIRNTTLPAIKAQMSSDLQEVIIPVSKPVMNGYGKYTISYFSDELFLLSEVEIFGTHYIAGTTSKYALEGTQYAYYTAGNSKAKGVEWWQRSWTAQAGSSVCYCTVNTSGNYSKQPAADQYGVSFAFCV